MLAGCMRRCYVHEKMKKGKRYKYVVLIKEAASSTGIEKLYKKN
jgi:hypothetical protein